eukprot:3433543-Amphidinium_carterae.1
MALAMVRLAWTSSCIDGSFKAMSSRTSVVSAEACRQMCERQGRAMLSCSILASYPRNQIGNRHFHIRMYIYI